MCIVTVCTTIMELGTNKKSCFLTRRSRFSAILLFSHMNTEYTSIFEISNKKSVRTFSIAMEWTEGSFDVKFGRNQSRWILYFFLFFYSCWNILFSFLHCVTLDKLIPLEIPPIFVTFNITLQFHEHSMYFLIALK